MTKKIMKKVTNKKKNKTVLEQIKDSKYIYLLLIPGLVHYAVFSYGPMYGVLLAFKDYKASKGIMGSPWIGMDNFTYLITDKDFLQALSNTLFISLGRIIFEFCIPIILALLFNELRDSRYKKGLQTIFTFPHFLSWIIISSILINLLASDGAVNNLAALLGMDRTDFLASKELFVPMLYFTNMWKSSGWGSIVYLAAITSINQDMYEAATIDGANRFEKMFYITWPSICPTVVIMLVLQVGSVMNAGFDQIFNMQNPAVQSVSDIIDTYVYRITFQSSADFGFGTAVGLFKSVINFILLVTCDRVAKLFGENGILFN